MSQKQIIAVIDYGSGNIRSVVKALEHVITEHSIDFEVIITNKPDDIARADRLILPGQGAFADCMNNLKATKGMIEALEQAVLVNKTPFLGICVGMQLLATKGLEHGEHLGLNWIEGEVVPLDPEDKSLKIPHMGWNLVNYKDSPVSKIGNDGKNNSYFYFVHSFMFKCKENEHVLATCNYGGTVVAIVAKDNIIGVQFHPEKSQEAGLELLHNFLLWRD